MRLRPLIEDIVNDVNLYPNVEINDISTNSRTLKREFVLCYQGIKSRWT
ncbi:hypothetical protein CM15mP37_04330 [bacterium]|nr:MAG: hypothetical protein CM15mP37_04330 [bacterium]